jgi:GDP-D-mannose 3',5'-epimerase
MPKETNVLVTGAGGFIGHHLVKYLVKRGCNVRGVDIKEPEYEETASDDFVIADLRNYAEC